MTFTASFHAAFTGFIHFLVGIPVCVVAFVMLFVQITPMVTNFVPSVRPIVEKLEDLYFLQGENAYTFGGRCIIDAVLVFLLIFYMHRWFLGFFVLALIVAVIAFKDTEVDLFQEVFGQGAVGTVGTGGAGMGGMGGQSQDQPGGFGTGGYQTVIES